MAAKSDQWLAGPGPADSDHHDELESRRRRHDTVTVTAWQCRGRGSGGSTIVPVAAQCSAWQADWQADLAACQWAQAGLSTVTAASRLGNLT